MKDSLDIDLACLGNMRSIARIRGFVVLMDKSMESGGEDTGLQPTELLLPSLGGCFISSMARALEDENPR